MSAKAGEREQKASKAATPGKRGPSPAQEEPSEAPATAEPVLKKPRVAEGGAAAPPAGGGPAEAGGGEEGHEAAAAATEGTEKQGSHIIEQGTIQFFYRCALPLPAGIACWLSALGWWILSGLRGALDVRLCLPDSLPAAGPRWARTMWAAWRMCSASSCCCAQRRQAQRAGCACWARNACPQLDATRWAQLGRLERQQLAGCGKCVTRFDKAWWQAGPAFK